MLPASPPKNYKISSAFSYNFILALTVLLARKGELEREGGADAKCDRVRTITATLEAADSSIGEFRDDTVRQLVSSIRVLNRERLSIRFKDGTEIEQIIECVRRASA